MRVLILATDIYTRGGIARYTFTFASAMADVLGPENVDVLALFAYGHASDFHPRFRVFGPVTDRLTGPAKVRYAMQALALARKKYDLIVCSHLSLAPVAAPIRFACGTPFWVACHGTEAWHPLSPLRRVALRRSDLLLPISRYTAEKLREVQKVSRDRVSILHNAIPKDFEGLLTAAAVAEGTEASVRSRERILLSVGSLASARTYKGFDTVIRALPAALERVPCIRYVIVGEGDDQPHLEKLAAEHHVGSRVTFAGSVSDEQLARYYRSCDVFVLPSKAAVMNGNWGGEGFGRVYVEAALAGKPSVGSRSGGAAEAVLDGKTGFLVDPFSVDEVARAVITLLGDGEVAGKMGAAGHKWALENFTQRAMSRTLERLLRLTGHSSTAPRCLSGEGESQRHSAE